MQYNILNCNNKQIKIDTSLSFSEFDIKTKIKYKQTQEIRIKLKYVLNKINYIKGTEYG